MLLPMNESFSFTAAETTRVDLALMSCGKGISRREAKRLLDAGRVAVEGKIVKIASRTVRRGERISLVESSPSIVVLKETPDFIAIDKLPGLSSQPAQDPRTPSALELVNSLLRQAGPAGPVHVVHRLDTTASGVLVYAKHSVSAAALSEAFRKREVTKIYIAIVDGAIRTPLTIDAPISKESAGVSEVGNRGLDAMTVVTPLRSSDQATLVAVSITTGRMHQIRAHLASVDHPIRGDRKYGSTVRASRLFLHAIMLEHASTGTIVAPVPEDFTRALSAYELSQISEEEILRRTRP